MTSKLKVNLINDSGDNNIITSDGAGSFTASSGLASSVQSVGGIQNTPAFRAEQGSNQNISDAVYTKAQIDSENFDTDGCYDTSNYRFTPTTAGKYFVYAQIECYGGATDSIVETSPAIRRNGSNVSRQSFSRISGQLHVISNYLTATVEMNGTTDYVEVFAYCDSSSTPRIQASGFTYFGAYRIIGA